MIKPATNNSVTLCGNQESLALLSRASVHTPPSGPFPLGGESIRKVQIMPVHSITDAVNPASDIYHIRKLNRYPTIRMPTPTTPTKVAISVGFSTFRRIIISGSESAITDIIKARTVPSAAPFSIRA